ncbi:WxL protein host-binding domain-containing protein [Xylocopilactobacillus apicola]|uniref:Cell wall surface anchor protein n=1 Tax=Xylocopilactobacillus apicola TaxID=2932184 RepID=A0AAU9D6U3_9LACO|nr:DUF3324 domain-containing protein [Xylocopilactobacillus apicola]BDR59574.1 cell wall surface anchor protein [Xylocopilactobacillus apicola]
MENIRKFVISSFLLLMGIICTFNQTLAAQVDKPGANFVVTPNRDLTPNSNPEHNNNLWITVTGTEQTIGLNIDNKSDKDGDFLIVANSAYTGVDGQIHYDLRAPERDETQLYNFRYLVKDNEQRVTVPANTKQSFKLNLELPQDSSYHGQVLGAVTVYQLNSQDKFKKGAKTEIVNRFAVGFPIALNFGGSEIPVNSLKDPFKIGVVQPGFGLRGGLAILAQLRNTKPAQMLDFTVKGKITDVKTKRVLFRAKNEGVQMAPNSIYNYQIYWTAKDGLKAGTYQIALDIQMPGKDKYHLKKNFTITPSQAAKLNEHVGIKPDYRWLYILLAVIALILLLLLTFFISRHQRNKHDQKKLMN